MKEPKQIIVMRKDLNMRKGKMVAQGAHASMAAILQSNKEIKKTPALEEWLNGRFTKICVSVNSEEELLTVYNQAKEAGIICSLITDAGLTEFNGVPTITCAAIGPDYPEEIDPITKDLKLL